MRSINNDNNDNNDNNERLGLLLLEYSGIRGFQVLRNQQPTAHPMQCMPCPVLRTVQYMPLSFLFTRHPSVTILGVGFHRSLEFGRRQLPEFHASANSSVAADVVHRVYSVCMYLIIHARRLFFSLNAI
jgi:hypothetical protein